MTSISDKLSIRTLSRTKDVNITGDVEPSPTYDHVQDNSTENTILKTSQEHEKLTFRTPEKPIVAVLATFLNERTLFLLIVCKIFE